MFIYKWYCRQANQNLQASNDNTALKMNIIVIFSPLFVVPQKGFIKTFKAFIKSFEAPQRSVKIKT